MAEINVYRSIHPPGFRDLSDLQILLCLLFLLIYILTLARNTLIIMLVMAYQHFHTPMYFFLGNLDCVETCYTFTILPRMLVSLLIGDRAISVNGCIMQFYFIGSIASAECYLSVMSYEWYIALCKLLHYGSLMNSRFCLQLATGFWISGFEATCITVSVYMVLTTTVNPFIYCLRNKEVKEALRKTDHKFTPFTKR